jgi:cell fate (sporulation/competence/biofilm development) regulator YlbF (YheA/YmcA/DUF963 family)
MDINQNNLSSAICDLEDIKRFLEFKKLLNEPKDNEGTQITINDCIEDIMSFLNELEN